MWKTRREYTFPEQKILKSSQLFTLFPSAFHYPLYAHLSVIVSEKIQTIKKVQEKPGLLNRIEKDVNWPIHDN